MKRILVTMALVGLSLATCLAACSGIATPELVAEPAPSASRAAETRALVASNSCNAFQPDHCGSCDDTLPFREALQVTVPWCSVGLCPPGREPWFCNPAFSATPIMCNVVGGNGPEALHVYCCDPVAANQICLSDSDCGIMQAECYQSKCANKACVVEPKPFNTPCANGVCRFWEPGRPMACGQDTI